MNLEIAKRDFPLIVEALKENDFKYLDKWRTPAFQSVILHTLTKEGYSPLTNNLIIGNLIEKLYNENYMVFSTDSKECESCSA